MKDKLAAAMGELTAADIGKMYHVPWSPNPHRLVKIKPRHCSLHGEFLWMEAGLIKRRNSEKRPWGSAVHMIKADDPRIIPIEGSQK